ncbi:MAG: hypothetical protein K1X79_10560 [Oligoflexia bacterium]|nr:hypothetical protein [Oligoflexia bacterium]
MIRLFGLTALLSIGLVSLAEAEHICRADVNYLLKREKEQTPATIFYRGLEARGADEAAAKAALAGFVESEKPKVLAACKREHESEADCVAAKYAAMGTQIQNMSFAARKGLETAIANDCKSKQGLCESVASSEPKCSELLSASQTPAAEAGGKEAGKGAKEDKKKK